MAIRKRYELVLGDKVVLRLRPKQDTVRLERPNPYGGWTDPMDLDREGILELRDCLDEIFRDWFCNDEPSPQELYRRFLSPGPAADICAMPNCKNPRDDKSSILCAECRVREPLICSNCGVRVDGVVTATKKHLCWSCYQLMSTDQEVLVGRPTGQAMQGEDEIEQARRTT